MDIVKEALAGVHWENIINNGMRLCLILVFAFIAVRMLRKALFLLGKRLVKTSAVDGEPPSESRKRIETLMHLLNKAMILILWLIVGLMMLKEVGIEIGPIIAGAGVAGIAVGFGAQNLVRDILAGFFIILENQIRVGDVAIVNGTRGLVEKINFRTTVLRDQTGTVHIFQNGTISTLSNLTNEWSAYVFNIGVAYKEDTDRVVELLKKVGKNMREEPMYGKLMIGEPEVFGVDKISDASIVIQGRIKTIPIKQWDVGREYLRRVKKAFEENNIEIKQY